MKKSVEARLRQAHRWIRENGAQPLQWFAELARDALYELESQPTELYAQVTIGDRQIKLFITEGTPRNLTKRELLDFQEYLTLMIAQARDQIEPEVPVDTTSQHSLVS